MLNAPALALALLAAPAAFAQNSAAPAAPVDEVEPPATAPVVIEPVAIEPVAIEPEPAAVAPASAEPDLAAIDPLPVLPPPDAIEDDAVVEDDAPGRADAARQFEDDPRTAAERDFDALYAPQEVPLGDRKRPASANGNGGQQYDPVADPTLPAPAELGGSYDPWERYNRRMHRFNNAVDRTIARPLARAYVRVVPRPVRLGVSNFFSNLGQPVSVVNALLQGKPKQAAQALGRFALNSTLGIGGIFDPASDAELPNKSEDFGQTLGIWGWQRSRYVELPLFGPRTVRDTFGMVGDAPLSPLRQVEADKIRIPIQGLQLVEVRAQLLSTDSLRAGAEDDYALVRDAWSQRRDYQIFGDRLAPGEEGLPDYLLEENNPTVPVDAIPVMPPGAN